MTPTKFRSRRVGSALNGIFDVFGTDVPATDLLPGPDYSGGTGLLDPLTDEAIPYTVDISTDLPPTNPVSAGIDVNALIKVASGALYKYVQSKDAQGKTIYTAKQVRPPQSNTFAGMDVKTLAGIAILAFVLTR